MSNSVILASSAIVCLASFRTELLEPHVRMTLDAQEEQCKPIKMLDVRKNSIGDAGAAAVADLIHAKGSLLHGINLSYNCVGLNGFQSLLQAGVLMRPTDKQGTPWMPTAVGDGTCF